MLFRRWQPTQSHSPLHLQDSTANVRAHHLIEFQLPSRFSTPHRTNSPTLFKSIHIVPVQIHHNVGSVEVRDECMSITMKQLSTPIESNPMPSDEEVPRYDYLKPQPFSHNGSRCSQNHLKNGVVNGDFLITIRVGNETETRHLILVHTATPPEDCVQSTRDTPPDSASSFRKEGLHILKELIWIRVHALAMVVVHTDSQGIR